MPAPPDLAGQISSTVEDPWQRILAWFSAALWRPVLATGLPLALGFVIGLVQVGHQAMADRYAYFPLIGIFIIVSWALRDLVRQSDWHTGPYPPDLEVL